MNRITRILIGYSIIPKYHDIIVVRSKRKNAGRGRTEVALQYNELKRLVQITHNRKHSCTHLQPLSILQSLSWCTDVLLNCILFVTRSCCRETRGVKRHRR